MTKRQGRLLITCVLAALALLAAGWLGTSGRSDEAAPTSRASAAQVIRSLPRGPAPELLESCADTADEQGCDRRRAAFESCEASGFAGRRCRDSRAVDRDRRALVTDCRRAADRNRCQEAGLMSGAYLYCRFEGRPDSRCETPALYAACVSWGGGSLCRDAAPGYADCRVRRAGDEPIARRVCVEGIVQYASCRHAWTVEVTRDLCQDATAGYEDCRVRSAVPVCEKARDERARALRP